jgi:hydroxypyruvate isomerase
VTDPGSPFVLAASAEMLFVDLPMERRIRRLHDAGFHVEIWDWRRHDLDRLARLHRDGVTFTSMTGYIRGTLGDRAGADELLATAAESIPVARRIGAWALNLHGTGLDDRGLPVVALPEGQEPDAAMWEQAHETLTRMADLGAREGVTFVLENLNRAVDHPGVPFAAAADTLALVSAVDSPHLRLNLDLYHAQIGEGNLIDLCRRAPALDRRDPGRRRPRPVRAGHRRDQLCGRGPCPGRHGVCRRGRPGVLRLRRPRRGARCLRLTRY